jgi:hypothetical protein
MRLEQNRGNRSLLACLMMLPLVAFAACGGGEAGGMAMEMEAAPAPEPVVEQSGPPRIFFVAPEDGAILSADLDVELEFGSENYQISAIPEEFDAETDTPRPDMGHFHVGVNAECLPAGEVLPQGEGWVHFGDGSNVFTLQVEPGAFTLSLQIGDDAHRTQEGLCETITIEVADGV